MRARNIEYPKKPPGRPKLWPEALHVKLPGGGLKNIACVLHKGETRAAFVREAIAKAVKRRKPVLKK
jgi:hypothetical protein